MRNFSRPLVPLSMGILIMGLSGCNFMSIFDKPLRDKLYDERNIPKKVKHGKSVWKGPQTGLFRSPGPYAENLSDDYITGDVKGLPSYSDQYMIDEDGYLRSKGSAPVIEQLSWRFTSLRNYSGGKRKPGGIIYHKTAGRTCGKNSDSIEPKYRRPHIYICRNGNVIVNGSFHKPRTGAEKYHNEWSLNIEFEASYTKKPCRKPSGGGHCYEKLTEAQLKVGGELTKLLHDQYNIPLEPALNASTADDYYSYNTYITAETPRTKNSVVGKQAKGILPSFWTRRDYEDGSNHDDGPEFEEFIDLIQRAKQAS